jgi:ABC-2 type transport system ATP-binding protein
VTTRDHLVVRISGLHKQFGGVQAIRGLELEIHRGEIFGLVGPNGAGKTTTIKILMGLTKPSGGRVEVLGRDPQRQAREVRALTGYAMQQTAVDLYLTGRENLRVFAELFNLPGETRRGRVAEVLRWAGLDEPADRLVLTYSGGMRRRLNLALSLLHRPALFFLDEPTLGLDIRSRRRLWQLIEDVKASGTTVVLTTHYLEEANRLCDRVGIMDRGKLVGLGAPETLKRHVVDDLHRLTIRFEHPPTLDALDLPVPAQLDGAEVTLTGSHARLWDLLHVIEKRYADAIQTISYEPPTLDDVVMRLTESGADSELTVEEAL